VIRSKYPRGRFKFCIGAILGIDGLVDPTALQVAVTDVVPGGLLAVARGHGHPDQPRTLILADR